MPIQRSFAVTLFLIGLSLPATGQTRVIDIDHLTGIVRPSGKVALEPDEWVYVTIHNTNRDCYTFDFKTLTQGPRKKTAGPLPHDQSVTLSFQHDAEAIGYEIDVKRRPSRNDTECPRADRKFAISVRTYEWAVGFAGAFTYDELINPVFYLEAGERDTGEVDQNGNAITEPGNFIRDNPGAEDSHNLGAATMVHLFHSDPKVLRIGKGIQWAPLSFGLGAGQGSSLSYLLGTSLKIGNKAFLTVGNLYGERQRLPDKFAINDFTTDANALDNLPNQTDSAVFVGISYTFLSSAQDTITNRHNQFVSPNAQPDKGPGQEEDEEEGEEEEEEDQEEDEDSEGPTLTGTYRDEADNTYEVSRVGEDLKLAFPGDGTVPLIPGEPLIYTVEGAAPGKQVTVEFVVDEEGKSTMIRITTLNEATNDSEAVEAQRVEPEEDET